MLPVTGLHPSCAPVHTRTLKLFPAHGDSSPLHGGISFIQCRISRRGSGTFRKLTLDPLQTFLWGGEGGEGDWWEVRDSEILSLNGNCVAGQHSSGRGPSECRMLVPMPKWGVPARGWAG